jgi:signal transduction histidine kinase
MPGLDRPELSRMLATPLITIGTLGAILVWEFENVGSRTAAVIIATCAIGAAVVVAVGLRARIIKLSEHYESLLATADEQSRRAEQASRVKDEFLSTLSHELRTPLNSILGWARLLASRKLNETQTMRAIGSIDRAGWAQSRLIENLLDVSRIAEGRLQVSPRPTDIIPIVHAAIDMVQPAAESKRLTLRTAIDPKLGPINADPDRLHQVIWHLVSNAVKFTPADGAIDISVKLLPGEIRLIVRDTGVGFPPEMAEQLFQQFRQGETGTTRQYGGLGLGLAIVRHVVEQHGGSVTARSAGVNQGAEFEVRLPMSPVAVPVIGQSAAVEPAPLLRGLSVLVVDDNAEDREFVRTSLEYFGAVVRTAASAHEARERFCRDRPDVVVSDLMMPDEDGLELIRQIRAMDEHAGRLTPAAALSALARSEDRRRALNAGYQMHVTKPIDPFELASTIERLAASRGAGASHA